MTGIQISRRSVLIGGGLALAGGRPSFAQSGKEIVIGALYPTTGPSAQIGSDARAAFATALDIINGPAKVDTLMGGGAGLPSLGGAKVKVIFADTQADPQKGRSEAERLITQDKVAALIGCYHSGVSATVSVTCERYGIPFLCADSTSPSLQQRGLKYFFRPCATDVMATEAIFDFLDWMKSRGKQIRTVSLFHDDTIWGVDSAKVQTQTAQARGYTIAADIKYKSNSPSLTAEVQQLKSSDPDVLIPSSYTTDAILLGRTMKELGYEPKNLVANSAGFSEQSLYEAVGASLDNAMTRDNFSPDLSEKRPVVSVINTMYHEKANRNLNDMSARQVTGLLVLADAINRAGSIEGEKIRAALVATDIPGDVLVVPWKGVKFDTQGQNIYASVSILQRTGGRFRTVFPSALAVAEPIWPMHS
ncbi:ABC transporter substrate-binding protein [Xanthobacter versatilis]|uniref:ABC transporter substrate-binding protein n=1 Tax=Xanthobacter autotrophicus (strain ATCC BAA-1158 / Py2) TaxID=78245 RepID=UPI00372B4681